MMTPYLHFQGRCLEAMTAYQAALGGELTVLRYREMPGAPAEFADTEHVVNSQLISPHGSLRASDFAPGSEGDPQKAVTVCLEVDDVAEGKELYDRLLAGGDVIQEYGPSFFAAGFGMFRDRFGTHWMIVAGQLPE